MVVDARELHAALGVGKDFSTWIKSRIKQYGFVEHQDYVTAKNLRSPISGSSKAREQVAIDYYITLDMAKELAMVERNEKGRAVRKYFIECERRAYQATKASLLLEGKPMDRAWLWEGKPAGGLALAQEPKSPTAGYIVAFAKAKNKRSAISQMAGKAVASTSRTERLVDRNTKAERPGLKAGAFAFVPALEVSDARSDPVRARRP